MKKLVTGLGVLLVIVAVAIVVLMTQLDRLVKYAVEEAGTAVAQVEVTLDKAKVRPRQGSAALYGLVVNNPPGFESPYALSLGRISVTLDPSTVTDDVIMIREVAIDQPAATYELGPKGSNIKAIQNNVAAFGGDGGGAQQEPAPSGEQEAGKKVVIENLYVREGRVMLRSNVLKPGEKEVTLPSIHLKDIGKRQGGATGTEVAALVLEAINKAIARAVADANIDELKAEAREKMDAKKEEARSKLEESADEKLKGFLGGEQ